MCTFYFVIHWMTSQRKMRLCCISFFVPHLSSLLWHLHNIYREMVTNVNPRKKERNQKHSLVSMVSDRPRGMTPFTLQLNWMCTKCRLNRWLCITRGFTFIKIILLFITNTECVIHLSFFFLCGSLALDITRLLQLDYDSSRILIECHSIRVNNKTF